MHKIFHIQSCQFEILIINRSMYLSVVFFFIFISFIHSFSFSACLPVYVWLSLRLYLQMTEMIFWISMRWTVFLPPTILSLLSCGWISRGTHSHTNTMFSLAMPMQMQKFQITSQFIENLLWANITNREQNFLFACLLFIRSPMVLGSLIHSSYS